MPYYPEPLVPFPGAARKRNALINRFPANGEHYKCSEHYSSRVSGINTAELNNTRDIILIGRYVTERIEVWKLNTV